MSFLFFRCGLYINPPSPAISGFESLIKYPLPIKITTLKGWLFLLAGDEGFEPPQTESESGVLPLHKSPICPRSSKRIYYYTQKSLFVKKYFSQIKTFYTLCRSRRGDRLCGTFHSGCTRGCWGFSAPEYPPGTLSDISRSPRIFPCLSQSGTGRWD